MLNKYVLIIDTRNIYFDQTRIGVCVTSKMTPVHQWVTGPCALCIIFTVSDQCHILKQEQSDSTVCRLNIYQRVSKSLNSLSQSHWWN